MTTLDAGTIGALLGDNAASGIVALSVFPEIGSTNTFLMQQDGPPPRQSSVALTDNQTQGRGRHGRTWVAPAGSGLCLSIAYTFEGQPENLPALTLAIGIGVIEALEQFGVDGVQLKWPNDLIVRDGKLGGILTESQPQPSGAIKIVAGVGVNVDLSQDASWASAEVLQRPVIDLAGLASAVPDRNELAAQLISSLHAVLAGYEVSGFADYAVRWSTRDWLLGREVTIDTPQQQVTGVGAGIADDGALLIDTGDREIRRITSGSVVLAGARGSAE